MKNNVKKIWFSKWKIEWRKGENEKEGEKEYEEFDGKEKEIEE